MGQHVAKLVLLTTSALGGCSLIYGPHQLPEVIDAPTDAPLINSRALKLERVSPQVLLEGQGMNGSRPAVLVIHGENIAPGAKVSIAAYAGEPNMPLHTIIDAEAVVDDFFRTIAVPITLDIDDKLGPSPPATSEKIRLVVRVTQPAPDDDVSVPLGDGEVSVLTLQGLPELKGQDLSLSTASVHLVSHVEATSIRAADAANPLIVRSTSSITITGQGPYSFNGNGQNPGPGGHRGGNGGQGLVGAPGRPGNGDGGGITAGGGGGFALKGADGSDPNTGGLASGDASLTSWRPANRGSGGAGGNGAILDLEGGRGGGGGGAVELSAAGNMMIAGKIEALGGNGSRMNGSSGGGGSGGAVLLRAGGSMSVGGVDVRGGMPGPQAGGGAGSPGRIRFDCPDRNVTFDANPSIGYRGPMLSTSTPLIVREERPNIVVVGQPGTQFKYVLEGEDGTIVGPFANTVRSGDEPIQLATPLFKGLNKLCVIVDGTVTREPEAENCITLAYLERF